MREWNDAFMKVEGVAYYYASNFHIELSPVHFLPGKRTVPFDKVTCRTDAKKDDHPLTRPGYSALRVLSIYPMIPAIPDNTFQQGLAQEYLPV